MRGTVLTESDGHHTRPNKWADAPTNGDRDRRAAPQRVPVASRAARLQPRPDHPAGRGRFRDPRTRETSSAVNSAALSAARTLITDIETPVASRTAREVRHVELTTGLTEEPAGTRHRNPFRHPRAAASGAVFCLRRSLPVSDWRRKASGCGIAERLPRPPAPTCDRRQASSSHARNTRSVQGVLGLPNRTRLARRASGQRPCD